MGKKPLKILNRFLVARGGKVGAQLVIYWEGEGEGVECKSMPSVFLGRIFTRCI